MLVTACLLLVLALHVLLRVARGTFRVLALDPWDTLVHLGLAEREERPRPLPRARLQPHLARPRARAPRTS